MSTLLTQLSVCHFTNLRAVFMKQQLAYAVCDSKLPQMVLLPLVDTCTEKLFGPPHYYYLLMNWMLRHQLHFPFLCSLINVLL